MYKPKLEKAEIVYSSRSKNHSTPLSKFEGYDEFIKMIEENNMRETAEIGKGSSDLLVHAKFKLIERSRDFVFYSYRTQGTSCILSLFNMVQGIYHPETFNSEKAEKSDDYDEIPESRLLRLPKDYEEACDYIESHLIGKTLRVIARSPAKTTKYGTRYYLFAIEDEF